MKIGYLIFAKTIIECVYVIHISKMFTYNMEARIYIFIFCNDKIYARKIMKNTILMLLHT